MSAAGKSLLFSPPLSHLDVLLSSQDGGKTAIAVLSVTLVFGEKVSSTSFIPPVRIGSHVEPCGTEVRCDGC